VQTFSEMTVPPIMVLTFWMLGRQDLRTLFFDLLTVFPKIVPLPQISHCRDISCISVFSVVLFRGFLMETMYHGKRVEYSLMLPIV